MVSCGMVGMAGVVSQAINNGVISAYICSNDDLYVNVCGYAHCSGCVVNDIYSSFLSTIISIIL